jgi:hypothetical protein
MLRGMREDRADIDEIRKLQFERDKQYLAIDEWLASPETIPLDSMAEAIDAIFLENRTLYPRRSAWTTIVATGQLSELDEPSLGGRLGNFYARATARVIDNDFGEDLND